MFEAKKRETLCPDVIRIAGVKKMNSTATWMHQERDLNVPDRRWLLLKQMFSDMTIKCFLHGISYFSHVEALSLF